MTSVRDDVEPDSQDVILIQAWVMKGDGKPPYIWIAQRDVCVPPREGPFWLKFQIMQGEPPEWQFPDSDDERGFRYGFKLKNTHDYGDLTCFRRTKDGLFLYIKDMNRASATYFYELKLVSDDGEAPSVHQTQASGTGATKPQDADRERQFRPRLHRRAERPIG